MTLEQSSIRKSQWREVLEIKLGALLQRLQDPMHTAHRQWMLKQYMNVSKEIEAIDRDLNAELPR